MNSMFTEKKSLWLLYFHWFKPWKVKQEKKTFKNQFTDYVHENPLAIHPELQCGQQQDAHEFMMLLFETFLQNMPQE